MAVVSGGRSTLNPDAPLFVPAVFRQVEDFSPEWWELVKTSTWFRDYWLNQHQEEEELFYGFSEDDYNNNDVANLLPESFEFDFDEEFPNLEFQLEELVQSSKVEEENESTFLDIEEKHRNGLETDPAALMQNLSLSKTSKERGFKVQGQEHVKHREKPVKCGSPKCSPRRINQPR